MKHLSLLIILFLSYNTCQSQDIILGFNSGLASYKMAEMTDYNDYYTRTLPFTGKVVDNFPSWLYYRYSIGIEWTKIETGFSITNYSTAYRFAVEDYSGSYQYDNRLNTYAPGLWFNVNFTPDKPFKILGTCQMELPRTKLVMDEKLIVFDENIFDESLDFYSNDFILETGLKLKYPVHVFNLNMYLGYALQINGEGFTTIIYDQTHTLNRYAETINPGWNGFRFGLGVDINFTKLAYGKY